MKELHELREKLCKELKGYGNKDMTAGSLDVIDKLAHAVKNIDKIINEGGYSNRYMPDASYTHRDDMGRYSRGYSYHEGMVNELRNLMGEAHNEEIRQDIKRLINKVESM